MRVLLAGATGVLGRALTPLLTGDGHTLVGTSRSEERARALDGPAIHGEVLDVYDDAAITRVLDRHRSDALICQITDLPDDAAELPARRTTNARVRREAVPALITAAATHGVGRILVQSVAWPMTGEGAEAVEVMERATLNAGGVVVRYGQLYGPGTFHPHAPDGPAISVAAAALRTVELLEAPPGVVTLVDEA